MTHADLSTLLDFHYWARARIVAAAARLTPEQYTRDLQGSFRSIRDTLVHLYSAEWAWYQRWMGVSPTRMLEPDDYPDVPTLDRAWSEHESKMRAYLASLDDETINRMFDYRSFAGQAGRSAFWEMLQHVVNHGTYHRGQVTTMLRQLGAEPAKSVDLIVFHRERNAAAETGTGR